MNVCYVNVMISAIDLLWGGNQMLHGLNTLKES